MKENKLGINIPYGVCTPINELLILNLHKDILKYKNYNYLYKL